MFNREKRLSVFTLTLLSIVLVACGQDSNGTSVEVDSQVEVLGVEGKEAELSDVETTQDNQITQLEYPYIINDEMKDSNRSDLCFQIEDEFFYVDMPYSECRDRLEALGCKQTLFEDEVVRVDQVVCYPDFMYKGNIIGRVFIYNPYDYDAGFDECFVQGFEMSSSDEFPDMLFPRQVHRAAWLGESYEQVLESVESLCQGYEIIETSTSDGRKKIIAVRTFTEDEISFPKELAPKPTTVFFISFDEADNCSNVVCHIGVNTSRY